MTRRPAKRSADIECTDRPARTDSRREAWVVTGYPWLVLAAFVLAPPGIARAETASVSLQVSAQVLPHAQLRADASPVTVTAVDVQRGYLDVSRHYLLRTNAPDRVVLQLNPRIGLTDSIEIKGLQASVHLRDAGLEIAQLFAREFTLQYRLWLAAGATPGDYPLPVQLAALVR
jgi:hypothetical protein